MKTFEILERIGLPEQAVKIYLALLEHGHSNVSDISRHAEMHRPDIYRFLPILEDRRLITKFVSGKRTRYRANDPKHLKDVLSHLESRLDRVIETLQEGRKHDGEGIFEYAKGEDAIRSAYENGIDSTPTDGTIFRYTSKTSRRKTAIISSEYSEKRRQKRIFRKVITNERRPEKNTTDPMRESVAFPVESDLFDYDITKSIAGDTVTIVNHETSEVFSIKNRKLALFEQKLFELLFGTLKRRNKE